MKGMLLILFPFFLFGHTSFITPMEYASSLYKNPRGIGCQNCHGESGEGRIVARYEDNKEKKIFAGPEINNMKFNDFYAALNTRKNGMPRYFLTQKEIQSLYFYMQEKKKEKSQNAK